MEGIREAIEGVNARLDRMEEEQDFYKELLELPRTRREISASAAEEDAPDAESV